MNTRPLYGALLALVAGAACGQAFSTGTDAGSGGEAGVEAGIPLEASTGPDAGADQNGPPDAPSPDTSCGSVKQDPANCGACGHSCLGGTCTGGVCQPMTLATAQAAPTAVVAYDFAPASTRAIWEQSGVTGTGAISHCHFGTGDTCAPLALASSTHPHGLFGTTSTLYWFDGAGTGDVVSMPTASSGSSATVVAATAQVITGGAIAADSQYVYWTDDQPPGHLFAVAANGTGAPVTLASTTLAPTAATVDGLTTKVDWVNGPTLMQCPADTVVCTAVTVAALSTTAVPNTPSSLVAYAGSLYWTSPADGAVAKCTPSTCVTSLQVIAKGLAQPVALAVDASGIYWVERGSVDPTCPTTAGRVAMCPLAGCGSVGPTVLSTGDACPDSVATSTHAVVWVDQGSTSGATGIVKAVAKP